MNNQDKILIFGGAVLQCSLIRTAKKMGYYTIILDPDCNAIGQEIADDFITLSGNDFETTLNIAKKNNVKGLATTATDKPLLMMAKVAQSLNLFFPTYNSISNTINKFKLKQILLANNIPCAKGILTTFSEIKKHIQHADLKFPLIIKPIDCSGSRGVFYCTTEEELKNVFEVSAKYSKFNRVLIEEFLEGPEISVEALVQEHVLHIVQITDKITSPFPYNVEMGHIQPSRFYNNYFDKINYILSKSINALNLNNCALHPEMKITKDGIKIIEIGPRLGGDFITSHLTPLSSGVNMEEQLLNIAVGKKINLKKIINKYSAVLFFDFSKNTLNAGEIKNKVEELKGKISAFELLHSDLTKLPVITNSLERHGYVIFSADSLQELLTIKKQLSDEI